MYEAMRWKTVITFGFWQVRILKIQKGVAGTLNSSILGTFHFSETEFYKKQIQNLKGKGVVARRVMSEGGWGAYRRKFTA